MRNVTLIAVFLCASMGLARAEEPAQDTADSPQAAKTEQQAGDQERSPQQKRMDQLAEIGIRQGLKAIGKSGSMYPFALIQSGDTVQAMGYQGEEDKRPIAEDWAKHLFRQLEQIGQEKPQVELMALFRLHEITNDQGETVPGIWAQVDHRKVRPWVIFLPLVENEDGKREPGEMVYYATEQPLFDHAEASNAKKPQSD